MIYDLDAFIEPRQKMLTDGTLTEFREWEVAERTEIFGSIAHRFSEYRKSGFHQGEWFEGSGHKTTQFVRTPAGVADVLTGLGRRARHRHRVTVRIRVGPRPRASAELPRQASSSVSGRLGGAEGL